MSAPVADQVPQASAADPGQLRRQVRDFLAVQRSAGVFEPRCALATEGCLKAEPPDTVIGDHRFACFVTAKEAQ